jgi:uncharacterized membrane protein
MLLALGCWTCSGHPRAPPQPWPDKLLLVVGLLRGKLWSYPASLVALGAFMAYQVYRYSYTYSAGLLVLTVFDAIVMVLIWHEWRVMRENQPAAGSLGG